MNSSIHELLQREAQAVLNIPVSDAYEKAVELIVEQVHRKKGKYQGIRCFGYYRLRRRRQDCRGFARRSAEGSRRSTAAHDNHYERTY